MLTPTPPSGRSEWKARRRRSASANVPLPGGLVARFRALVNSCNPGCCSKALRAWSNQAPRPSRLGEHSRPRKQVWKGEQQSSQAQSNRGRRELFRGLPECPNPQPPHLSQYSITIML
jgi:hypothetical protein